MSTGSRGNNAVPIGGAVKRLVPLDLDACTDSVQIWPCTWKWPFVARFASLDPWTNQERATRIGILATNTGGAYVCRPASKRAIEGDIITPCTKSRFRMQLQRPSVSRL